MSSDITEATKTPKLPVLVHVSLVFTWSPLFYDGLSRLKVQCSTPLNKLPGSGLCTLIGDDAYAALPTRRLPKPSLRLTPNQN